MKKVATVFLATALAVSVSGQVFAAEVTEPAPIVQNVDVSNAWKAIDSFKATVDLQDKRYTVSYDDRDGIVNVVIKKETGKEVYDLTGQEANDRVIDFIKSLNLSTNLSKEEVINRLSTALGVEPSEVQKVDAKLSFTNNAHLSFSYKKGEKSKVIDPYQLKHLKVQLKANDGTFYNVHLSSMDPLHAVFIKKTKEGTTVLKNGDALSEIYRIKDGLIPTSNMTFNGYFSQVSDALGVNVTDITKVNVDLQFANHTKVDLKFGR